MTQRNKTKYIAYVLTLLFVITPNISSAIPIDDQTTTTGSEQVQTNTTQNRQTGNGSFNTNGIFGCAGGKYGSVGLSHARGTFVPVSEEAVALNTNLLLYKECILDKVAVQIRETMVAFMVKSTLSWVNKNNNGESAFVTNLQDFENSVKDKVTRDFATGKRTENICAPVKQTIRRTLLLENARDNYSPEDNYKCSVPDDSQEAYGAYLNGEGVFNNDTFFQVLTNNPLLIYAQASEQLAKDTKEKLDTELRELDWGQGYKSHKSCSQIPSGNGTYEEHCKIVTPGSNIKEIIGYVSLTGQRQTESADEINELMGSLMSNIHTQILTSVSGLGGISKSNGGNTPYIDQVTANATQRAQAGRVGTGSGVLADAIQVETDYNKSRKDAEKALERTITLLKSKEGACWGSLIAQAKLDLISEVVGYACNDIHPTDFGGTDPDGSCGITGSATIKTATSTTSYDNLSLETERTIQDITIVAKATNKEVQVTLTKHNQNLQSVLDTDILPLLSVVKKSIKESDKNLAILLSMQASLVASNTPSTTKFVLTQLDQLVASGKLHKSSDIYIAREQKNKISALMSDLYNDTADGWDIGWCDPTSWRTHIKN